MTAQIFRPLFLYNYSCYFRCEQCNTMNALQKRRSSNPNLFLNSAQLAYHGMKLYGKLQYLLPQPLDLDFNINDL